MSREFTGGKKRSDHLMDLMLCCHPVDTSSATWDQASRWKRRVKADRQGNPFSFLWKQRASDYRLLTTQCFLLGGRGLFYRHSHIVCILISHCFLCLSAPYVILKLTHAPYFSPTACKPGYFKPSVSSELCRVCPDNTKPSAAGATECFCEEGFFRSPSDPPTSACSGKIPARLRFYRQTQPWDDGADCSVSFTSFPSSTRCPPRPHLHHLVSRRQAPAVLEPTAGDWRPQWPHLQCCVRALRWRLVRPLRREDPVWNRTFRPAGHLSCC